MKAITKVRLYLTQICYLFIATLSVAAMCVAPVNAMNQESVSPARISSSLPAQEAYKTTLAALNGDSLSLAGLRGKKVYIKFWATWCPQCLAGLEDFKLLSERFASSSDVAIISIVAPGLNGEVSKADFIEWANAQELSFPIYFDETGDLLRAFGVKVYPTSVYLDKNGNVLKVNVGDELNPQILATLALTGADAN